MILKTNSDSRRIESNVQPIRRQIDRHPIRRSVQLFHRTNPTTICGFENDERARIHSVLFRFRPIAEPLQKGRRQLRSLLRVHHQQEGGSRARFVLPRAEIVFVNDRTVSFLQKVSVLRIV